VISMNRSWTHEEKVAATKEHIEEWGSSTTMNTLNLLVGLRIIDQAEADQLLKEALNEED
jgi:hypothetical protein